MAFSEGERDVRRRGMECVNRVVFFFFQAEDGIRDVAVTGVQTCALPISILAVLLGCGLRRRELSDLTLDHLQRREEHWAIMDLVGKGRHIRTVPVPDWVKRTIDDWRTEAGVTNGRLFRRVCRAGTVWGEGITEKAVWHVVKEYAAKIGCRNSHHTI